MLIDFSLNCRLWHLIVKFEVQQLCKQSYFLILGNSLYIPCRQKQYSSLQRMYKLLLRFLASKLLPIRFRGRIVSVAKVPTRARKHHYQISNSFYTETFTVDFLAYEIVLKLVKIWNLFIFFIINLRILKRHSLS